jgi:dihydroorotase
MSHTADTLVLRRPDDWHAHLRDGEMLRWVAPFTARQFARAIVMPNLAPPVTRRDQAEAYRQRILDALGPENDFTPLMTCYLTDDTDLEDLRAGWVHGPYSAAKLYPAHATTHSAHGVTDVRRLSRTLALMEEIGMPLLVHGEATDPQVDVFDREAVFIDRTLAPLLSAFPGLKVVFEHITTAEAVAFVQAASPQLAATITPHHLHLNRNALFQGGLRPHAYCLPLAKREAHRQALRRAAVSGSPKFFLGTDSAPHVASAKESDCGCAGIFNAPSALESYAEVFEAEGALHRLEAFASEFGARFYDLPLNEGRVVLEKAPSVQPTQLTRGDDQLIPFHAGETLAWRFAGPARG